MRRSVFAVVCLLALSLARPASAEVIATERPNPSGSFTEEFRSKVVTIPALKTLTKEEFDALEAVAKDHAWEATVKGGWQDVAAEVQTVMEQQVPCRNFIAESMGDVLQAMGITATGTQSAAKDPVTDKTIEQHTKDALSMADSSQLMAEEGRREFWKTTGIYEQYSDTEIKAINQLTIPTLVCNMVFNDYNELFHLWQGLNGTGAEVSSRPLENGRIMNELSNSLMFNGTEQADYQAIMDAYNGSTAALGALALAAKDYGSGADWYSSVDGILGDYLDVLTIPPAVRQTAQPEQTLDSGGGNTPSVTFRLGIKLTQ